jgi:predicted CoA-binding protein
LGLRGYGQWQKLILEKGARFMANLNRDPNGVRELLKRVKTIAVVGYSDRPDRPSYQIAQFLERRGYDVYPVNPTLETVDGKTCYPSVEAIPVEIDLVDVFRRPEYMEAVVDDAIAAGAKAVWMQLGIHNEEALQKAVAAGLDVVSDQCIKIEYARLMPHEQSSNR